MRSSGTRVQLGLYRFSSGRDTQPTQVQCVLINPLSCGDEQLNLASEIGSAHYVITGDGPPSRALPLSFLSEVGILLQSRGGGPDRTGPSHALGTRARDKRSVSWRVEQPFP
jgi:hypothetical protein